MILIKPHHLVDIITSFGAGQRTFKPHPYGHAVHTVSQAILDDPNTTLKIELGADDICRPCKHNINGFCDDTIDTSYRPQAPSLKREWNLLVDHRWCERLGIRSGDTLSARELARLILDKMGDITGIYQEIPADMTAQRNADLVKGLKFLLKQKRKHE